MAELDQLREVEQEEEAIKNELEAFERELAELKERNVKEAVQLDYETNKNWINFRETRKGLVQKNKDLAQKLAQTEEAYKKNAQICLEKNNQSYNYFEQKQIRLSQKLETVG